MSNEPSVMIGNVNVANVISTIDVLFSTWTGGITGVSV